MLELENITAGYGDTVVLRDVTVSVPDAKVVTLLGPNGAGKSTALKVMSGQLAVTKGTASINGQSIAGVPTERLVRGGLCVVPEGRGIFPSLSVKDNLILQSPKGKESATFERALTSFPALATRLKQTAGSLSGGEQQMLALVRTFASEPKIVVVDEASLGLAPIVVDRSGDPPGRAVRHPRSRPGRRRLPAQSRRAGVLGLGRRTRGRRDLRALLRHRDERLMGPA